VFHSITAGAHCLRFRTLTAAFPGSRVLGLATLLIAGALPAQISRLAEADLFPLTVGDHTVGLPYHSSRPLDTLDPTVRRIVVVIHGISHNGHDYYRYGVQAMDRVPGAENDTLVIGLWVLRMDTGSSTVYGGFTTNHVRDNMLYWRVSPFWGSQQGRYGAGDTAVNFSVFAALDQMLFNLALSDKFPSLRTMVLFGYSGGGQLVQRYAAAGRFNHAAARARGVHLRYGVGAPSTYAYMDERRPVLGQFGEFAVPSAAEINNCPGYDTYGTGVGVVSTYAYVNATGTAQIRAQFKDRIVGYIVGGNDNDPESSSLARGCDAMLQGRERVERMVNFYEHLKVYYGPEIQNRHVFDIEPGFGHSGSNALRSPAGLRLLFDYDPRDSDNDGVSDWDEWMAGTNPHDPADRPRAQAELTGDGNVQLRWAGLLARRYVVESWSNGGEWVAAPPVYGVDGDMTWPMPTPGPVANLHRLRIALD